MKKSKEIEVSQDASIREEENSNEVVSKKEKRKKNVFLEILRFVVIGILCTAIDFAIQFCLMKWAFPSLIAMGTWAEYLSWGLSVTIAFIVATIVNFIFSRLWVYQNVDKSINTKSFKAFWIYFFLGLGGWAIGLGLQELGVFVCNTIYTDLHLTYDFTKVSFESLFTEGGLAFWAFVVIFVIKTIVTMVYNYLTRKFVIFKKPKKEEENFASPSTEYPLVVTATPINNKKEVKETPKVEPVLPKLATVSSFKEIFHEEMEATLGKGYYKTRKKDAKKMVLEELDKFEKTNPTK